VTQELEWDQIQALVLQGYKDRPAAAYGIFRIDDAKRARAWLGGMLAAGELQFSEFLATSREEGPDPKAVGINVAFSHPGLEAMGLPSEALAGFNDAFQEGMAVPARSRQLGDDGESDPSTWRWGRRGAPVHGVLCVYGGTPATRTVEAVSAVEDRVTRELSATNGLALVALLPAMLLPLDQKEHFGFRDGISNPVVEGMLKAVRGDGEADGGRVAKKDVVSAGEFLLGYRNAYEELHLTPRVRPERDPDGVLDAAADDPDKRDFGRNGSFLVFRQLEQKVASFERYVAEAAEAVGLSPALVAAKLVGRWPNGAPLTLHPDAEPADYDRPANDFLFADHGDDLGARCPIGAHIRRTNPRDTALPEPYDPELSGDPHAAKKRDERLELTNRRRIIRRGRIYHDETTGERGLHFLCFNGSIRRQFEFVQSMWSNNPHFAGLRADPDPFTGPGRAVPFKASGFTIQGSSGEPLRELPPLPRFVETRGGAYFFMPGKKALAFLAREPAPIEVEAPNEREDALADAALHREKIERDYEKQARDRHAKRGFHVKCHGIVRAKLVVRHDLPEGFRHGIFRERGREYDAWVRYSSSAFTPAADTAPDARGVAIKVMGVDGPRADGGFERQTQDLLMIASPILMVGTIAEALPFDRAMIRGNAALLAHLATHPAEGYRLFRHVLTKPLHPLAATYSSVAPFRLGPTRVVRWALRPASGAELVRIEPGRDHLREALRRQLAKDGRVELELCVEVRGARHEPIDDCSVDWRGARERIADLILSSEGFGTGEQEALGEKMSFNPWNALEAHRPLGNLNRARRIVYRAIYGARTRLNGLEPFEPTPDAPRAV
jgi:Dyp-type peroxidase family